MKFEKKQIRIFMLVAALAAIAIWYKRPFTKVLQTGLTTTQDKPTSALSYFSQKLDTELEKVWTSFKTIGISKQQYDQALQNNRQKYLRSDYPNGNQPISPETRTFVQGILKEFGIDPKEITLVGWKDISPAGASEKVMYINQEELNKYSDRAKRFVIGHEIQHILHQDNFSRYTLELMLNNQVEKMGQQKDHPLCQFNRFKETRADVKTALKGKEWAEGYLEFTKVFHKRAGNNPGITHPLIQDRIALAQEMVDYMKKQPTIA